ncbi:hypothetical protein [Saccharothrix stipae]
MALYESVGSPHADRIREHLAVTATATATNGTAVPAGRPVAGEQDAERR